MDEQLIETWQIHNRIHFYLLDVLKDEILAATLNPKSRSVYELFAHIHNVRLLWLKAAAPELMEGMLKLETKVVGTKESLRSALELSGARIEELLRKAIANGGKVKGFKPHVVAFVGYLISHESHHRGQIGWTLKYSGHALDQKTAFGLWEWGVR